jgi:4-hydroxy-tetrahydrodipicolinate reductase
VLRAVGETHQLKIVAAIDNPNSTRLGKDAGEITGAGRLNVALTDDLRPHLEPGNVIIDFSRADASLRFLRAAATRKIPVVIGTTGFSPRQLSEIRKIARRTPVLLSANMSLGVNLLVSTLGGIAAKLGDDYDVEFIEAHHRFKKDAPSGTALALAKAIAAGLNRDLDKVAINGRKGMVGARPRKEIALLSVRAGDIAGEHTVIIAGIGERLEFIHRAHSRETFARGAVRAAEWLARRKPGLYAMQDVLGL